MLKDAKLAKDVATNAVFEIKKRDLVEMKSFAQPPQVVKKTMFAVCMLLGKPIENVWADIKKALGDTRFNLEILAFDASTISSAVRQQMIKKYINDKEWTFENVSKASRAAASFLIWVRAQVKYAQLMHQQQLKEEGHF